MNNKLFKNLFLSFAILSIILFSAAWFFSSLILYPKVNCTKQHHVFCDTPKEIHLNFESVTLKTLDDIYLESWYIPSENSKKGIVLVHGHGGSRNEGLRFAETLNKAGYNLLALSLRRNSNQSGASMGFHEVKDVKAAVDFLLNDKKLDSVGIFGFSMGAATSILAMESDNRIKVGLFSSGFSSALDVMTEAAKRDYSIPYYPLIPLVKLLINIRGDMNIETVRPVEKIGNITPRPIFIMQCDKDHYVNSKHAELLFAAAKEPKEKWIPKCDKHEFIWNTNKEEAESRVVRFFTQNL